MSPFFEGIAPKKSIKIIINSELLVSSLKRENWRRHNAMAIAAYNKLVDEHRALSDDVRGHFWNLSEMV